MIINKDHISVCVCTFKREELLRRLIESLQEQITDDLFNYSIVVVDNDNGKSAENIIKELKIYSKINIYYYNEKEQNIALARNMAVDNAVGNFIAFIDDDEFPIDEWLLRLYKTLRKYNSGGVLGPVIPQYEEEPPRWVIKGKFFERPTHETGTVLHWKNTRTGNVLLKKTIFNDNNRFNKQFLTGEDREFFQRMIERGHVFIWCNDGYVYETVPPLRWKKSFMIKRALFRGKISSKHSDVGAFNIIRSLSAVFLYSMFLPFSILIGQHVFMRYLIKSFDHIGKILSFFGIEFMKQKYVTE